MTNEHPPPRPTGRLVENVNLCGLLLMWKDGHALTVTVFGTTGMSVPVFTSKEALELAERHFAWHYDSIKQITDHNSFLEDVEQAGVGIVVDPYLAPNGKVRYLQVFAEVTGREQNKKSPDLVSPGQGENEIGAKGAER